MIDAQGNVIFGAPDTPLVFRQDPLAGYYPSYNFPRDTVAVDFFAYQFPASGALATGQSAQVSVTVQADSDFEMREIVYFDSKAAAEFTQSSMVIPNVLLNLLDTGSGRNLFSSGIPIASIASSFANSRRLIWPKTFSRNSSITATFTNFDAAVTTSSIYLTLIGRKIFYAN